MAPHDTSNGFSPPPRFAGQVDAHLCNRNRNRNRHHE